MRNRRSRIEIETRGTRAKSIVFLFLSNTQRVRLGQSVVRMAETRKVISYRLVASVIFRARQIDLFCTTQGSFKVENSVHRVVYRLHSKDCCGVGACSEKRKPFDSSYTRNLYFLPELKYFWHRFHRAFRSRLTYIRRNFVCPPLRSLD